MTAMTAAFASLLVTGSAVGLLGRWELRRRGELVVRACHELRGPLSAAHLAIHASTRRGAMAPDVVVVVEAELERARLALDDLAAAPRGRRGGDRAVPVDVGTLLESQARTWRAAAPTVAGRVEVAGPPSRAVVLGDPVRLAQAIANLVANGLEHGDGTVALSSRSVGDRVRIEVTDTGPGLPAPVAALTRGARRGVGRRGRGLAIASAIAQRHGGRLVSAPAGQGARLAIELPAWPAPALARRASWRRRRAR